MSFSGFQFSHLHFLTLTSNDPYQNMAIDEYLFRRACNEKTAVLRIYSWDYPSITLGYFQDPEKDLNIQKIRDHKIPMIRRLTGGRAVFHDQELTWSFSMGRDLFSPWMKKILFEAITGLIRNGFDRLKQKTEIQIRSGRKSRGEADCFASASEYEIIDEKGHKILGSAQLLQEQGVFQQGSIPLYSDGRNRTSLSACLKVPSEGLIKTLPEVSPRWERKDLLQAIRSGVQEVFPDMTENELNLDDEKIKTCFLPKYRSSEWNLYRRILPACPALRD